MRTASLLLLAAVVAGCTTTGAAEVTTSADTALVEIGAGLSGPAGTTATVFASGLPNVAAFAFDAAGRLWVATAAFTDGGTDTISVVTVAGASPRTVVSAVHTALGLAWDGDTLYVASAGRIDAYRGFDGSAFTDHRTVVTFDAGVGEVNGLVIAPSGRLMVGISSLCDACSPTDPQSAAILSVRTDGTDLRVEASGIRAPVGLAYLPGTDDLLVTMDQRDDLGEATPGDWLALVRSGQAWGFPACFGQGGAACAGVPAPLAVLDPHAAVSGVAVLSPTSGPVAGMSAVVAEWATGRVLRAALTRSADGIGYRAVVEPFLTGVAKPVAVVVAPDGALFVGDWGSGTIYRVVVA